MKKLIALAVVVFFAAQITFAVAPTWNSGDKTGQFTAFVECTPTLTGTNANVATGSYFNDGNTYNLQTPVAFAWSLKGDAMALYTIVTATSVQSPATTPAITLTDAWTGAFAAGSLGSSLPVSCINAYPITYGATAINVPAAVPAGTYTWTVTLAISATTI